MLKCLLLKVKWIPGNGFKSKKFAKIERVKLKYFFPAGQRFSVAEVYFARFENGKVAEFKNLIGSLGSATKRIE